MSKKNDNIDENEHGNIEVPKMSIAKKGMIAAGALLALFIVLVTVGGVAGSVGVSEKSDEKRDEKIESNIELESDTNSNSVDDKQKKKEKTKENSAKTENENIDKTEEKVDNSDDNNRVKDASDNVESNSADSKNGDLQKSKEGTEDSGSGDLLKVDAPELGETLESSVIISSKEIFKVDSKSYAYSVGLIIPSGDGYEIVKYFCPKKTYDALNTGDAVNAQYQVDANGVISISTISK